MGCRWPFYIYNQWNMTIIKRNYIISFSLIGVLIVLDQWIKIWVKTHFAVGESLDLIGDWCKLFFVENEGIAFGISFGENVGKLILTLIRLVASVGILVFLVRKIGKGMRMLLMIGVSLIFVGAVGNLIDSCFYGLIFNESTSTQVATLFPEGGGYGRFFYGRVVDMFYFPIAEWTWPSWMPWFGGKHAEFFNAIFNLADASVCVGVGLLIVDQLWGGKCEGAENEGVVEVEVSDEAEKVEISEK